MFRFVRLVGGVLMVATISNVGIVEARAIHEKPVNLRSLDPNVCVQQDLQVPMFRRSDNSLIKGVFADVHLGVGACGTGTVATMGIIARISQKDTTRMSREASSVPADTRIMTRPHTQVSYRNLACPSSQGAEATGTVGTGRIGKGPSLIFYTFKGYTAAITFNGSNISPQNTWLGGVSRAGNDAWSFVLLDESNPNAPGTDWAITNAYCI